MDGCPQRAIPALNISVIRAIRQICLLMLLTSAIPIERGGAQATSQRKSPVNPQPRSQSASISLTPFAREKARTLLRQNLSCLGCHQLNGEGGTLAPRLDDVLTRRNAAYIAAIINDPAQTRPGAAMPRARMPANQRTLITQYLGGTFAGATMPVSAPGMAESGDVAVVYQKWCAGCHGATGRGDGPNAKFLPISPSQHANASIMQLRSDDALFDTIFGGGAIMNRSARMPAFGESLTTAQVRALVRYIRTLCRCEGPAWSRDGKS